LLALVTYGGSADSAYRIARYAQNFFSDFLLFVPNACKSEKEEEEDESEIRSSTAQDPDAGAGTLIALGANQIYMSPFGEFGPLDVQVFKSDEIFERRSGLTSKSAVWSLSEEAFRTYEQVLLNLKMRSGGTITFKSASNVASAITTGMLAPVAAQLDPLSIGEDYQNLHISGESLSALATPPLSPPRADSEMGLSALSVSSATSALAPLAPVAMSATSLAIALALGVLCHCLLRNSDILS
jgi:hypothetical protein